MFDSDFFKKVSLPYATTKERYESRLTKFQEKYGKYKGWCKYHFWWVAHNCVAHNLIGLFPCKRTFDLHDYTSNRINLVEKEV